MSTFLLFQIEDKIMRETIEQSRMRIQEFEERQRRVKQEPMENPDVADYRSWQLSNAEVCQVSLCLYIYNFLYRTFFVLRLLVLEFLAIR